MDSQFNVPENKENTALIKKNENSKVSCKKVF